MSNEVSHFSENSKAPFRGFGGEAIILAGGLGTRLRDAVPDLPKCMAPVAGQSFLSYVIRYLLLQGIQKFIFSLGYKHEVIEEWLADKFTTLDYQIIIEPEPLGTGGAILLACRKAVEKNVIVANGDTIFKANIQHLVSRHIEKGADCTLALKPMKNFDRYGSVELEKDGWIRNFKEKQLHTSGLINGGVYVLNRERFLAELLPEKISIEGEEYYKKFSFEKDYLEKFCLLRNFNNIIDDGYFIDIGIPEDYNRAQQELKQPPLDLNSIDKSWTLFIDRDGVINYERENEYITTWQEFKFYEGVLEAFQKFGDKFGKIIIISNQRGVGKGLMTEADLLDIHQQMQKEVEEAAGRIDNIYYCTSTDMKHPDRKPNPGMFFSAKKDFSDIDLSKSIMIGNKPTDMLAGRNAGIYTVFVKTTNPGQPLPHPDIDLAFDSLFDFAKTL